MEDPGTPTPEPAADTPTIRVGVLLTQEHDKVGDWLTDASAFDAAGADALWVDPGPEPELDVLAITAALAVVTFRSRLVVALPEYDVPAAALARTLDTVGRLSDGRLCLLTDVEPDDALPAIEPGLGIFRHLPGEPGSFEGPGPDGGDEAERWTSVAVPEGRAAWRAARDEAAASGVHGLILPADPLLLDLLRNPDRPGDRSDLRLAQG